MRIPARGAGQESVLGALEGFRADDLKWRTGKAWAYVFDAGREAEEVCKKAYAAYLSENGLDPTAFPSLLRLENEIVGMMASHLNAGPEAVGNFTSGGTESIMLAVKSARDWAREKHPEIREPEMILPHTSHAAFQKAGHYLGVRGVPVAVDSETMRADPGAVRAAITPNTILLVASATSYAHGVIDPIGEIAALAAERGLLCHVDGCIGGFVLPYFRRLGAPIPDFDFAVRGVTSMSIDLHKYAFAAKGASVVLYRSKELRRHQIYACSTWTGYTIVNPTVQSTKSGGPLAGAWAVLHFIGDDGYLELCRRMLEATRELAAGIERIDGLRLAAQPDGNLLAFASDTVSVFHIADEMTERGWHVQPQLAFAESPATIHLSVNPSNTAWVREFLEDLRASVAAARLLPPSPLAAMAKTAVSSLAGVEISEQMIEQLLAMVGLRDRALPKRMAPIHELMNVIPPELRSKALIHFANGLFTPPR
ncbi:MAG: aspartate aminotransferase family protein [Candidatus Schekmanbacteria bacterium]|nr:aspartate aminotransferase family protein [Candidatus Schekmanbacteria bacterium]